MPINDLAADSEPGGPPEPAAYYKEVAAASARVEARERPRAGWLSAARLVVASGSVAAAWAATRPGADRPLWIAIAAIAATMFIVLVALHRRSTAASDAARARRIAAEAGLARMARDWEAMPATRWLPPLDARSAALARDLGVVGTPSLFRLVDTCSPSLGSARVLDWLLADPPSCDVIHERAESVAALRAMADELLAFAVLGRAQRRLPRRGVERFVAWCMASDDVPSPMRSHVIAAAASALLATVIIALIAMRPDLTGAISIAMLLQFTVAMLARRRLQRELAGLDDALSQLDAVVSSLRQVTTMPAVPGRLGAVQRELRDADADAVRAFAQLRQLLEWNNIHRTPLAHWLFNLIFGLDSFVRASVLKWRAEHGAHAARWVDLAAEAEAHVALAILAFENPAWTRPHVHDDPLAPPIAATQLGHPLIAPGRVVPNELTIAADERVIVVSGSNMAGKTTYMRAAGLNTLLAQAGGFACASALRVRRCRVRTSVRVEDDLGTGTSLFFAEARRLQEIVREAEVGSEMGSDVGSDVGSEVGSDPTPPPVFFLLDEILHGTNARDRREATQLVLRRLAAAGAFGLVTTHDPEIAHGVLLVDGATRDARQLHFRETVERDPASGEVRMRFDYLVRPGPAVTTNALLILQSLGLGGASRAAPDPG